MGLTPEQVSAFQRDGFVVIRDWWDAAQVASLRAEAERLRATVPLPPPCAAPFTTGAAQGRGTRADYFLSTGCSISPLLEEAAYDGGSLREGLTEAELRGFTNKIGHALHDQNILFRAVSLGDARIAGVCAALGFARPVVPQSMLIFKAPGVGGAVGAHVDGAFLYTTPEDSVLGLWWPLDPCTTANGCLYVVPGSHTLPITRRFQRTANGTATEFVPPQETPFDLSRAIPLETPAGALVLLHGAVVHFSDVNASSLPRIAYSIHITESGVRGSTVFVYPAANWLQREGGPSAFPLLDHWPVTA